MTELGGPEHRSIAFEAGESPLGVIVREPGECRERLRLAHCLQPAARATAALPLPPLQNVEHVEVPERESLRGNVKHRALRHKQSAQPVEPPQSPVGRFLTPCERGLQALESGRLKARPRQQLEQLRVRPQRPLAQTHSPRDLVYAPARGGAEREVEEEEPHPDGRPDQAREIPEYQEPQQSSTQPCQPHQPPPGR